MAAFENLRQQLFKPIDASSLAVFRIGFGLILFLDVIRYWNKGWISGQFIEPTFLFKFYGFSWVEPWSGDGMYFHFAFIGLTAFLIMIGAAYRIATILFTLSFTYVFLLDEAQYLNHFYLVILFAILLCVIPAHRAYSVDAWLRPKLRSATVPKWTLWLLRAQMEIMLLYAGLVKIIPDWLQLEPLRMWLAEASIDKDLPSWMDYLHSQDWAVAIAAYGVIVLHVVGAPLLLWKRTRLAIFCIYILFHLQNHFVFDIGIFPWFTIFASLLFFDPDWPKQIAQRFRIWFRKSKNETAPRDSTSQSLSFYDTPLFQQKLIMIFLVLWITSQILIPLRHFLYPGNVAWTEEGQRFAWQMKLRDKKGIMKIIVVDYDERKVWDVDPREFLTRTQLHIMSGTPHMILQFAHFLEDFWEQEYGSTHIEIYITAYASLNGRKPELLIDPKRDLTEIERSLRHADWIMPMTEPLKRETSTQSTTH